MTPLITCATLIDITNTGVIKGQSDARDQQRNWETVLQCIGLRTQPQNIKEPTSIYFTLFMRCQLIKVFLFILQKPLYKT